MRIFVTLLLVATFGASARIAAQSPPPAQPSSGARGQTVAPPAPGAGAAAAPAGNAANGKKLFVSNGCWQCHGYEGQGSGATGPRLGPRPLPFPAFSRYVRKPTNQMPPYTTKVMTDGELADIYAFLQSLPAPPPVESIQLLK
jgi:mono/diheme cytochrome c family protein